jgi:hypothetical protein
MHVLMFLQPHTPQDCTCSCSVFPFRETYPDKNFVFFLFLLEKIPEIIICLQHANCGESVAVFPDVTNADFGCTKGNDKTMSSENLKQTN